MATVIFYEKSGCSGNAKQKRLLMDAGHMLIVHDLLETAWTPELLRPFFGQRPVSEWFNRTAPAVKSGCVVPEQLNEAEALAEMMKDPLLIRRPLLQVGEVREVGFDASRVDEWIGLTPLPEHVWAEADLETCPRQRVEASPEPSM